MLVAASTECYPELSLGDAISKLSDLEYTCVEIDIHESGNHIKPSEVHADPEKAGSFCRDTHRLDIACYSLQIEAEGELYYEQFASICQMARATKVVTLTVPSAVLGTPFNEEVERLRKLVAIAELQGVRVGVLSQIGRLTEDPDTVAVLCDNVKGLGLSLDPTHYICGPYRNRGFDKLMKYVYHLRLRDSKKDELQVRVGQGEVEYGRLVSQLSKVNYDRALCVHITPMEGIDHMVELRKMRLLLESLL